VAVARREQRRQQGARHAHQPEHVDLPHRAPIVVARLRDGLQTVGAPGIVDQQMDPRHLGDKGGHARRVGDVERQRHGPAGGAGGAVDLAGDVAQPLAPPGADDDLEAGRRQPARARRPDPGARSGHHRDLRSLHSVGHDESPGW
jgi:hypothetical protein